MKKFLLTSAALFAICAGPAVAADMPVKAPIMPPVAAWSWSGFYVGLNAGVGWGRSNWEGRPAVPDFDVTGGVIGGTLGINWQFSTFVFGLEGDIDYANIRGSTTTNCAPSLCETRLDGWLGTARARLGIAWDTWMPYVTGGAAFGTVKASLLPQPGAAFSGVNSTRVGWTVGGGLEHALGTNWTAKLEYLYVALPNFNCPSIGAGANDTCGGTGTSINMRNLNIVRLGVNYKFDSGRY